jgi:peptidoglycan/LPS O-acetylase OafA/YrhL
MRHYRPEIDGLRALSISSVVFFHTDLKIFASGFLGVDVFFVISGFLITNLILGEMEAGRFSLASFYERRVRRIIPAAAVVMIASAVCAWFMMMPAAFVAFCKSLLAAVFFSSNWYFLSDVSYFATPAATKPLLHTWTLSIEEQFYLVFPLVMLAFRTTPRRTFALSALCIASILYARWLTSSPAGFDAAFYNSFSRAFEPLVGCLTALAYRTYPAGPRLSVVLRATGLSLIAFAIMKQTAAGYQQLFLPCIGAAAFLFSCPNSRDPICALMSCQIFVAVGVMSYSIYLWHWPVIVFAKIILGQLDGANVVAVILLTLLLSALTLYAVENPIRFGRRFSGARFKVFGLACMSTAAIAILAMYTIHYNGLPNRLSPHVLAIANASTWDDRLRRCFVPAGGPTDSVAMAQGDALCRIGDSHRKSVDFVLWGDSHTFAISQAVSEFALDAGLQGIVAMMAGCPSLSNTVNSDLGKFQKCVDYYQAVASLIERHDIQFIFMVDRWSLYSDGEPWAGSEGYLKFADDWDRRTDPKDVFAISLDRTISEFPNRQVFLLKEPPMQRVNVTDTMAVNALMGFPASRLESRWTTRKEHLDRYAFLNRTFEDTKAKYNNLTILDPLPFLCNGDHCVASKDELPLYWDDDHLNNHGARLLKPLFASAFNQIKASRVRQPGR